MTTEGQTLSFRLIQAARSKGGDRYAAEGRDDFTIYVPQDLTRATGKPLDRIEVTIRPAGAGATL